MEERAHEKGSPVTLGIIAVIIDHLVCRSIVVYSGQGMDRICPTTTVKDRPAIGLIEILHIIRQWSERHIKISTVKASYVVTEDWLVRWTLLALEFPTSEARQEVIQAVKGSRGLVVFSVNIHF